MNRLIAFLVLFLALSAPATAECLSQGAARDAVASGQALPLGAVAGQAGGEIVKAELCQEGGRYVYRLSVLAGGQVTVKVINASQ